MRNAEAVSEWSQLEDEKKATMRATAKKLMDEMDHKQAMHDKVMAAARERVENATSDVARKLFKDDIRLHEENHAKELQQLEEQASQALATIGRDFSSRQPLSIARPHDARARARLQRDARLGVRVVKLGLGEGEGSGDGVG